MKLASFKIGNSSTWGVIEGDEAIDVGAVLKDRFPDLKSVIAADALSAVRDATSKAKRHPTAGITWLPVIPNPDKILCIGLNYETHRKETGRTEVENPTVFGRFANSQTGHLADIIRPKLSHDLDYEGELAVIIGKPGRHITRADAWSHIAGYACYNEGSVRDFQRHTHQFTPGKNFPGTGAFGPWMMTPDELGDVTALRLQTRLNGEIVQDATHQSDDFRYPAPDRILLVVHAARAGRCDRNRHARRRRLAADAAAMAEARRYRRGGNRPPRDLAQRRRRRNLIEAKKF